VVVEDEALNRTWLCDRLSEFPEVEVVGEAASVSQAFTTIVRTKPNGLFLDIKLIGGDAFQLLNQLKENNVPIPPIVMVTAFDEYAVQTINHWGSYVKRYLEKPFLENWEAKLQDCINALLVANEFPAQTFVDENKEYSDHIFVKDGAQHIRIKFSDLLWIEVAGGGAVYLVTKEVQAKCNITLTKLLEQIPSSFQQISRNIAVNLEKVKRIDKMDRGLILDYREKEKFLGIGDTYFHAVLNALKIDSAN